MKKRKLNSKNHKYHKKEEIKVRREFIKEVNGVTINALYYLT